MRLFSIVSIIVFVATCGGGEQEQLTPCADSSQIWAMPHPAWQEGALLTPPANDRAAEFFAEIRPSWSTQLPLLDGWSKMPTVVIPVSGRAETVDPEKITVYAASGAGGELQEYHLLKKASLQNQGRSLVIKFIQPLPEADEIILVVNKDALEGSTVLPVCDPDGQGPHPEYQRALLQLPANADAQLALPIMQSKIHLELVRLWERLESTPALNVAQIEERSFDSFGSYSPAAEDRMHYRPIAASGILELPEYRDQNGIAALDSDGGLLAVGKTYPGFVVTLPATGSAPYPVVLYQHGGSQHKENLFTVARQLSEAGFAFVAIDLPYHGNREKGRAGSDLDILDFDNPFHSRDNFRQIIADHMAVVTGFDALNAALESVFDVSQALDADNILYMGLSMGALSGSMTFANARNIKAAALFVGTADYSTLLRYGFFALRISDILLKTPIEQEIILGFAGSLMNGADPVTYAIRNEDQTAAPRPVIFMQAIDDPIVSLESSDIWSRSFGADLVSPYNHQVAGMQELTLPAADNFNFIEGGMKATRVLIQNPMAGVETADRHPGLIREDYSQELVTNCFKTLLHEGSCQIIDTGFYLE
jgi:pimeloyl-ACP methyl ester carboxylesterase